MAKDPAQSCEAITRAELQNLDVPWPAGFLTLGTIVGAALVGGFGVTGAVLFGWAFAGASAEPLLVGYGVRLAQGLDVSSWAAGGAGGVVIAVLVLGRRLRDPCLERRWMLTREAAQATVGMKPHSHQTKAETWRA